MLLLWRLYAALVAFGVGEVNIYQKFSVLTKPVESGPRNILRRLLYCNEPTKRYPSVKRVHSKITSWRAVDKRLLLILICKSELSLALAQRDWCVYRGNASSSSLNTIHNSLAHFHLHWRQMSGLWRFFLFVCYRTVPNCLLSVSNFKMTILKWILAYLLNYCSNRSFETSALILYHLIVEANYNFFISLFLRFTRNVKKTKCQYYHYNTAYPFAYKNNIHLTFIRNCFKNKLEEKSPRPSLMRG